MNNDDPLSRRDMGLEFLNVTGFVNVTLIDGGRQGNDRRGGGQERRGFRITSNSTSPVDTHLLVIARGLSDHIEMTNASGRTISGSRMSACFCRTGCSRRARAST
jgi:hypothetical protein